MSDDSSEEIIISSDMLHVLPDGVRLHFEKIAEESFAVLQQVQPELDRMGNLTRASIHIVTLEHIMARLLKLPFDVNNMDMQYFYELDLLTTAFVVTYVRLQQGKGFGFDPRQLPEELRFMHDEVVRLRNKRFAHDDTDLGFLEASMEVRVEDDQFVIHPQLSVRYQIGGNPDWQKLVNAIHTIYYDRNAEMIARLSRKTGKEWKFETQQGEE